MDDVVLRETYRGMGSDVHVEIVGGRPGHLSLARDHLAFLEARWSRFRRHSDISRLNHAHGEPVVVDDCTLRLLDAMVHGFTLTDGAFDPTLLAPLVTLGYAHSWHDPSAVTELPFGVQPRGPIRGVTVDANERSARLPPGTVVDPGGIGKGMAADLLAELLMDNGVEGALVSIGGDVRVLGEGPLGGVWLVSVDDAFQPDNEDLKVPLASGALGSSSALRRQWFTPEGAPAHHLLDPAVGHPTPAGMDSPLHSTVLAGKAVWAEVYATMVVVRGAEHTFAHLDELGIGARVVHGNGEVRTNGSWDDFHPQNRAY
jgi:thiamine biosynthesis lipoprotein